MNKSFFKKIGVGVASGIALFPFLALAQLQPPASQPILVTTGGIQAILLGVLNFVAMAVFIIAAIMLLVAAILYLTAGASSAALDKAKSILTYAIVGIVVALLAFSVRPFIENVLRGNWSF